jgi:hypothetical protein
MFISINMKKTFITILSLVCTLSIANADDESIEFSGFARAVLGHLNEENLSFLGYENDYSFGEQSLFAFRANASLTDKISFVAQAIAHTSEVRDSGIQWLYVDDRPSNDLSFKLGRQRAPFFTYSDVIDVGFAYPWITPPAQVYTNYIFSEFDGVLARYDFSLENVSGSVESYLGNYDGNISIYGQELEAKLDYLFGFVSTLSFNNFTITAAITQASVEVGIPELQTLKDILDSLNFVESANELNIDDIVRYYRVGASYNSVDFFVESELTRIESDTPIIPSVTSSYLTLGYNFAPYSVHATFANSDAKYQQVNNQIPLGFNPQLDALHFGFQQVFDSFPVDNLRSFTLGARYDLKYDLAFKAEVSFLNGNDNERAFFEIKDPAYPERKAVLLQLAVEWVF